MRIWAHTPKHSPPPLSCFALLENSIDIYNFVQKWNVCTGEMSLLRNWCCWSTCAKRVDDREKQELMNLCRHRGALKWLKHKGRNVLDAAELCRNLKICFRRHREHAAWTDWYRPINNGHPGTGWYSRIIDVVKNGASVLWMIFTDWLHEELNPICNCLWLSFKWCCRWKCSMTIKQFLTSAIWRNKWKNNFKQLWNYEKLPSCS